jgi:DNA-binding PadR family transcriptional regulator
MRTSKNELAVLGLIQEGPKYGYQIYQKIEKLHMEHWAAVSLASIYSTLNRLEKEGLIKVRKEKPGKMPERSVYHLTPTGRKRLALLVEKALSEERMPQEDFTLGLMFLEAAPKSKALKCLKDKKREMEKLKNNLQKIYSKERKKVPFSRRFLLKYGLAHLKMGLKHLSQVIAEVNKTKKVA